MMAMPVLPEKTLADLIGARAGRHGDLPVTDIALDSHAVQPGGLFVAIGGQRSHGLQYTADAVARGAAAIVYEPSDLHPAPVGVAAVAMPDLKSQLGAIAVAFFGDPAGRQSMVGITGTNGKTTVAYLIATAMSRLGKTCGYMGTLGSGIPPELTPGGLTTPDCFELHRSLADLYEQSARHVALEVSSHALDQGRTAGIEFQTAVFTNLSRDHLDYHGDLEHYRRSKARLFEGEGLRHAIVNLDDPFGEQLARQLAPRVTTLGVSTAQRASQSLARVLHGRVTASATGLTIQYRGPWGEGVLNSPLIGGFNGHNLLLAMAVLTSWDVDHRRASQALGYCQAPSGRMEAFRGPGRGPLVVVDFAHTPAALTAALDALKPMTGGRLWCVFGCGGERDSGKRPLMGAAAVARADAVVLTTDNPRSESPDAIVAQIKAGCGDAPGVTVELDRRAAIGAAISQAGPDDIVLVAGRGHEAWQLSGGERLPMSDRDFVAQTLAVSS